MKVLSKEEADAHYAETLKGGIKGGLLGLGAGLATAALLNRRTLFFRNLTLPLKAFYVTSIGSFATIIAADRASRSFEAELHHPGEAALNERERLRRESIRALQTPAERAIGWATEQRYPIVGVSWLASMGLSMGLVYNNRFLTKSQKLVQARVYAQGLTLMVLIATAALEVADSRTQRKLDQEMIVDPNDPEGKKMVQRGKVFHHERYKGEDMWKSMVAQEEEKIKSKKAA